MIGYKQCKAKDSETSFSNYCDAKKIQWIKLDNLDNKVQRQKFLIDPDGKGPDFWCRKNSQKIFVEVKTLSNFTNARREKLMSKAIREGRKRMPSFNPIPELRGPLERFLRRASTKFKNIKSNYDYPRILLLYNIMASRFVCHAIFFGAYDSYGENLEYIGMKKKETGLFDKIGTYVDALVFWNDEQNCFNCITNHTAKIDFPEDSFNLLFGREN